MVPLYVLNQVILLEDDIVGPLQSPAVITATTPDYAAIAQNFRLAEEAAAAMAAAGATEAETTSVDCSNCHMSTHSTVGGWLSQEVQAPVLAVLLVVFIGLVVIFVRKFLTTQKTQMMTGQNSLTTLESSRGDEETTAGTRHSTVYTISRENYGFLHSREDISEAAMGSSSGLPKTTAGVTAAACPSLTSPEVCQPSRSLYI
jgi:hypothetical protein